ncbi:hypothetical protein V7127_02675 [Bacillus sp. JJ1773]|uniref:hypothetical protein n=1 Tax=Bacillus sp. JJ1773 TaxID=3122965 RepID=UPI002FFECE94
MKGLLLRAEETGEILELIYMSDKQKLSQRTVMVLEVHQDSIKAFCFMRRMPRIFKLDNILSIAPARIRRGA